MSSPTPLRDSNLCIGYARYVLPEIADYLCLIAREEFGSRDVLTEAEITAIRARLVEVTTAIGEFDAELADPASGFRLMSGGTGASLTGC